MNEMERLDAMERVITSKTQRSAWKRGVSAYAVELLDVLTETAYWNPDCLDNVKLLDAALLNGAGDWQQYSEGGCSLIYDADIAERLCTPSELRRKDHGRLQPNSRETWIDVQARALYQAARMIRNAYRATK